MDEEGAALDVMVRGREPNQGPQSPPCHPAAAALIPTTVHVIAAATITTTTGVGLGEESVEQLKERATRNRTARANWTACEVRDQRQDRCGVGRSAAPACTVLIIIRPHDQVLIIDEISMLDGSLLAKLNEIAQHVKGSRQPFGGIQLICTGDFFQLPPVSKRRYELVRSFTSIGVTDDTMHMHNAGTPAPTSFNNQRNTHVYIHATQHSGSNGQNHHDFCFLHPVWAELFPPGHTFELTRIFRQADERVGGSGHAGPACVSACADRMCYRPMLSHRHPFPLHSQTAGGPPQRRSLRPPVPHLAAAAQLPQAPRRPAGGDRAHPALRDQREGGK